VEATTGMLAAKPQGKGSQHENDRPNPNQKHAVQSTCQDCHLMQERKAREATSSFHVDVLAGRKRDQ